jgi:hypothetical protein
MSADNGIYILPVRFIFPDGHEEEKFFVSERSAIENLEFNADTPEGYNLREVMEFVKGAKEFDTKIEALWYAVGREEVGYHEYGIRSLPSAVLRKPPGM